MRQNHNISKGLRTTALAAVVLAGVSNPAFALQPLITDDTGTQGAGGNQLEASYGVDRTRIAGETERVYSVPVTYSYGPTETIDVFASAGYSRIRVSTPGGDADGLGNVTLGAKWRFFENESGTSAAVKSEVALPVSSARESDGLGTGKTSGALTFILSQEVPFGAIHFNAGVGRDRFRNQIDNANTGYKRFSMAPVWDVSDEWKLALDMGVELARADGNTTRSRFAEIGAIYSPSKDLDLALGFIRTTDDETPKATTNSATVGVTWRF